MEFNIKLDEQDLVNGVPPVVQELLSSLKDKETQSSEKLIEMQLELQKAQERTSQLEEENSKLAEELSKAKKELQENSQIKTECESELKELNDKLLKANQECKSLHLELADYDFLTLVNGLSDKVKGELENFFPTLDNQKALLFSLLQKNKIEDFYTEVFRRVNNKRLENIEELKLLLRILYGYYCAGMGCQLIEPKVGQEFNDEECIEKETTLGRGKISKVLLFGVRNPDGTVRKEAMVSLEK